MIYFLCLERYRVKGGTSFGLLRAGAEAPGNEDVALITTGHYWLGFFII
jgi:hypothetical protein